MANPGLPHISAVAVELDVNVVVVVVLGSGKDLTAVHFAVPLAVSEDDALDLVSYAVGDAAIEKPISVGAFGWVAKAEVDVGSAAFEMNVGVVATGMSINAAGTKTGGFRRSRDKRSAVNDFL